MNGTGDVAKDLCKRMSSLESQRSTWDQKWQEIAERVLPQRATFQDTHSLPPERRVDRNFDSTAAIGLDRFAAVLESILTPKQVRWHSLQPVEPGLARNYRVRVYLDEVKELLFRFRYAGKTGFAGQISEVYTSLGAFGTGPLLIEDNVGVGISYRAIHLAETYLCTGADGLVDSVYRKFKYTARQAHQRYQGNTPQKILEALKKDPDKEFKFLHCVRPAGEYQPGAPGLPGMAYESWHVWLDDKMVVERGGYRTMPYAVPRYKSTGTPYGWSAALTVLPEIKTANEIRRTGLKARQLGAEPPILLHGSAGTFEPFQLRPGHLAYGMVSAEGRQLAQPFQTGANMQDLAEEQEQTRNMIRSAFLSDLFQILIQKPNMTATEVLEWSQEKGDLLAPTMGKLQGELLDPCIARELDILQAAGQLPEPPRELAESGGIRVQYEGPLSKLQRATEAAGFARTVETTAGLIQLKPEALDVFDADEVMRSVADINGVPTRWLLDPERVRQQREERAAEQQDQLAAEQMPGQAAAAKSLAQAAKLGQGAPA